jgi:hypothetical protein
MFRQLKELRFQTTGHVLNERVALMAVAASNVSLASLYTLPTSFCIARRHIGQLPFPF